MELVGLLLLIPYLLPTWIANSRRCRNDGVIFLVNFFLGWTVIGWVAALVWAATDEPRRRRKSRRRSITVVNPKEGDDPIPSGYAKVIVDGKCKAMVPIDQLKQYLDDTLS